MKVNKTVKCCEEETVFNCLIGSATQTHKMDIEHDTDIMTKEALGQCLLDKMNNDGHTVDNTLLTMYITSRLYKATGFSNHYFRNNRTFLKV